MARLKHQPEKPSGTFAALPHSVLDSAAFAAASYPAKALLLEIVRQLNGRNNGHLQLSHPWLKSRGWNSRDVISRAKHELIGRGLIMLTKQGGFNCGASQYLVTWLPVSNFVGLDISKGTYHPGAWALLDKMPPLKNAKPRPPDGTEKPETVPANGTVPTNTVPPDGTVRPLLATAAVPPDGNNVITNIQQDSLGAVLPPAVLSPRNNWATVLAIPASEPDLDSSWRCGFSELRQRKAA